jgi:hypothetical protein
MTAPYSDKLRDLDDLLGVDRSSMSDSEREQWAAKRDAAQTAAKQCKVRWPDMISVLRVLVVSSSANTGLTDQSLGQLETKTGLGRKTVQRALDGLKLAGLVADEKRGGGPAARSKGKQAPQATVRRLVFLVPLDQRRTEDTGPVDSALTEDTQRANSGHLEANSGHSGVLYYRSSTEPPTPVAVSAEARAGTGPCSGGQEKARERNATGDRWADQYAWNVARAVFAHEREQGTADKVRDPDAVIRTRKLPAAQEWVQRLLARSDGANFRLLEPSDRNLITWGVGEVLGDGGGVWAAGEACKQAQALAQQQRPAMGVA